MKIINIPNYKELSLIDYHQQGVAAPFSLGDVVIDPLGDVSVIIKGFGEDDSDYRGDMNGVQPYEGTRHATKEEIMCTRPSILEKGYNVFFEDQKGHLEVFKDEANKALLFLTCDEYYIADRLLSKASSTWGGYVKEEYTVIEVCSPPTKDSKGLIIIAPNELIIEALRILTFNDLLQIIERKPHLKTFINW